jgi:hypothetical protein
MPRVDSRGVKATSDGALVRPSILSLTSLFLEGTCLSCQSHQKSWALRTGRRWLKIDLNLTPFFYAMTQIAMKRMIPFENGFQNGVGMIPIGVSFKV